LRDVAGKDNKNNESKIDENSSNNSSQQPGPSTTEPWDLNSDHILQKNEADNWFMNGRGVKITVDNSYIKWNGLTMPSNTPITANFAIATTGAFIQLPYETAATYGGTTFQRTGTRTAVVIDQSYHYKMRENTSVENVVRNTATKIGAPKGYENGLAFTIHYSNPNINFVISRILKPNGIMDYIVK
jgi:hypothetical protein